MRRLAILPCGKRKIWDRDPLLGTKGIGEMLQRLKQAIENKKPLHD